VARQGRDPQTLSSQARGGDRSPARTTLPTVFLCLASPIIVEVLFGSTTVSILDSLLFEVPFYGAAAVLIREVVRRRALGWTSLLLLGIAFAIFEEFLVIQTSVSPVLFVQGGSTFVYGRLFGVNWVYALWAVGYESVWAVVLPVYATELVFPDSKEQAWLSTRGIVTVGLLFGLGTLGSWAIFTRVVTPDVIGHVYAPSPLIVAGAVIAIVACVVVGLSRWPSWTRSVERGGAALSPRSVGALMFVVSASWFCLVAFAFNSWPAVPAAAVMALGVAIAAIAASIVGWSSARADWSDRDRLAIVVAGLLASMILGFWASGITGWVNVGAKLVFDGLAGVGLIVLGRKVWTPGPSAGLGHGA
jgi:hypothetical protein